mmetsp:Transcript_26853/g.43646  ORF Transcript_26853/g.43646 Transcript_26853/m.43646 type:complete len:90 (-) Transcript_26853:632-901(-)
MLTKFASCQYRLPCHRLSQQKKQTEADAQASPKSNAQNFLNVTGINQQDHAQTPLRKKPVKAECITQGVPKIAPVRMMESTQYCGTHPS